MREDLQVAREAAKSWHKWASKAKYYLRKPPAEFLNYNEATREWEEKPEEEYEGVAAQDRGVIKATMHMLGSDPTVSMNAMKLLMDRTDGKPMEKKSVATMDFTKLEDSPLARALKGLQQKPKEIIISKDQDGNVLETEVIEPNDPRYAEVEATEKNGRLYAK